MLRATPRDSRGSGSDRGADVTVATANGILFHSTQKYPKLSGVKSYSSSLVIPCPRITSTRALGHRHVLVRGHVRGGADTTCASRAPSLSPRSAVVAVRATSSSKRKDDDNQPNSNQPETTNTSSRRGLLLSGASGLALVDASSILSPGSATASPSSPRVTPDRVEDGTNVQSVESRSPGKSSNAVQRKSPYARWSGTEANTSVGNGSLFLSPMGVGTWSWGNQFVWGYDESIDPELEKVFVRAVDAGINVFDTADSYGTGNGLDGRSEVLLGRFLRDYPLKSQLRGSLDAKIARQMSVNIASKFAPYPWRVTPKSVVQAAKESCERLGKDSIELGQLHWSTGNYQPQQETALWQGIADAYDQGVIRAVGLSNYGPKQLKVRHGLGAFTESRRLFAYRRARKGDFRRLWIQRINAGSRANGLTYNRFIQGLGLAGIEVDRRMLAELAVNEPGAFATLVEEAKKALPKDTSAPALKS